MAHVEKSVEVQAPIADVFPHMDHFKTAGGFHRKASGRSGKSAPPVRTG